MKFLKIAILIVIAAWLVACSAPEVKPEPTPEPPPPVVKKKLPPKKVLPPPPVVILVSEDIPAYQEVGERLTILLSKRAKLIKIEKGSDTKAVIASLKSEEYQQFAAIGLAAAKLTKQVAGKEDETVFCQVFNYQEHDLVGKRSKGVSALPGSGALFKRWSALSPDLQSVVVFSGPGLGDVIAPAKREAEKYGIHLIHKVVNSDKEVLFEYKQMAPNIQGLWLLPDNRVLSGRTIREMMSFSVRNSKQVAAFSDKLLRLGGLLSVSSSSNEIADKVARRLNRAARTAGIPGPNILLLEKGEVQVNPVVAKRYNLNYTD